MFLQTRNHFKFIQSCTWIIRELKPHPPFFTCERGPSDRKSETGSPGLTETLLTSGIGQLAFRRCGPTTGSSLRPHQITSCVISFSCTWATAGPKWSHYRRHVSRPQTHANGDKSTAVPGKGLVSGSAAQPRTCLNVSSTFESCK